MYVLGLGVFGCCIPSSNTTTHTAPAVQYPNQEHSTWLLLALFCSCGSCCLVWIAGASPIARKRGITSNKQTNTKIYHARPIGVYFTHHRWCVQCRRRSDWFDQLLEPWIGSSTNCQRSLATSPPRTGPCLTFSLESPP